MKFLNKKAAETVVSEVIDVAQKVPHKAPNKLMASVTSKTARQLLVLEKHSPRLLFAAGVTGVVATTVLACRATLRVEAVLENFEKDKETLADTAERRPDEYSASDLKKDQMLLYVQSAGKLTKLYAPSIVVGTLSIAALTKSHSILSNRNASLTAAYVALDKGFTEYRRRVVDEVGEEKERDIRYAAEVATITAEDKNGPKKIKAKVPGAAGEHSIYSRFFDEFNKNWNPTPEYNYLFLRGQQNYANDRLQSKGHVLLNDVYDALGIERTKQGCVVGWVKNPKDGGNGYIDFGIFEVEDALRVHEFVTGRENAILLDFNVDGLVYDLIEDN